MVSRDEAGAWPPAPGLAIRSPRHLSQRMAHRGGVRLPGRQGQPVWLKGIGWIEGMDFAAAAFDGVCGNRLDRYCTQTVGETPQR